MKKIFNQFFNSYYFDILPNILKRRLRKINYSTYFSISKHNNLPKSNYNTNFSYNYQNFILQNFSSKRYLSKNSYKNLSKLIKRLKLKSIKFFDFGAGDINTYLELIKFKNLFYYYYDIQDRRKIINKLIIKNKLKNINVINNPLESKFKFNFVFFGSSLGYSNHYKKILKKVISVNCKYILISGITLFEKESFKNDHVVAKQLNILPEINYLYLFNKSKFINLFKKNNYKIVFLKKNQFKKIKFKNLEFFSKKIEYADILFEKRKMI